MTRVCPHSLKDVAAVAIGSELVDRLATQAETSSTTPNAQVALCTESIDLLFNQLFILAAPAEIKRAVQNADPGS
jgi:hypothetical protein